MSGGGRDVDEDRFGCERLEELLCSLVLGFERRLLTEMELIVSATKTRVAMDFSVWLVPGVGESYRWTSGGDWRISGSCYRCVENPGRKARRGSSWKSECRGGERERSEGR